MTEAEALCGFENEKSKGKEGWRLEAEREEGVG
jgi:hypothetical protein